MNSTYVFADAEIKTVLMMWITRLSVACWVLAQIKEHQIYEARSRSRTLSGLPVGMEEISLRVYSCLGSR